MACAGGEAQYERVHFQQDHDPYPARHCAKQSQVHQPEANEQPLSRSSVARSLSRAATDLRVLRSSNGRKVEKIHHSFSKEMGIDQTGWWVPNSLTNELSYC